MLFYLFLLFTVVPIVELALLIWLGGQTVWWLPVLMVLVAGGAGALLWRSQGFKAIARIRAELAAGRMPAGALIDGLLVFLAGAFLIAPGMLTDVAGFALLIPPLRAVLKRFAQAWFVRHVEVRTAKFRTSSPAGKAVAGDQIIDARVISSRVEDEA